MSAFLLLLLTMLLMLPLMLLDSFDFFVPVPSLERYE